MSSCDEEDGLLSLIATVIVIVIYVVTAGVFGVAGFKVLLRILFIINLFALGFWFSRWIYDDGCYCRSYGHMILSTIANMAFIACVYYLLD